MNCGNTSVFSVASCANSKIIKAAKTIHKQNLLAAALACALGYCEKRHKTWRWREGRPALSAWFDRTTARPSELRGAADFQAWP